MPTVGETRTAPCTWCRKPVLQVWRLYSFNLCEGYWSEENCTCGELHAIVGAHNNMKHVGKFEGTIHARRR